MVPISSLKITEAASLEDLKPVPRLLPLLQELDPKLENPRRANIPCLTLSKLAQDLGLNTNTCFNDDGKHEIGKAIWSVLNDLQAGSTKIHEIAESGRKAECILKALLDLKDGVANLGGDTIAFSNCPHAEAEAIVGNGHALFYLNLATGGRVPLPVAGSATLPPAMGYAPFRDEEGNIQILNTENNRLVPIPEGVRSLELYRTASGDLYAKVSEYDPNAHDRRGDIADQLISISSKPGWVVQAKGSLASNPVPVSHSLDFNGELSLVYWHPNGRNAVRRPFSPDYGSLKIADSLTEFSISEPLTTRVNGREGKLVVCEKPGDSASVRSLETGRVIPAPKGRSYEASGGQNRLMGIDLIKAGTSTIFAKVSSFNHTTEFWRYDPKSSKFQHTGLSMYDVDAYSGTPDGELVVVGHRECGEATTLYHTGFSNFLKIAQDFQSHGTLIALRSGVCVLGSGVNHDPDSTETPFSVARLQDQSISNLSTPRGVSGYSLINMPVRVREEPQILILGKRGGDTVLVDVTDQCI